MTPELLPAANMAAGMLCLASAFLLAFVASKSPNCVRAACLGALSFGATLSGAALIFGNILSILVCR